MLYVGIHSDGKKDTSSYVLILDKIKSMIAKVRVTHCMSDYEAATRKAVRKIFPAARLSGCYFHYVQAIVKSFKRYSLNNDDKFKNAREEVSALALLPNEYVVQGFETISKRFKKSKRWKLYSEYWMKQWSGAYISVYGM